MDTRAALAPGEVIARIGAALDQAGLGLGLVTDAALLEGVSGALVLAGRIQAYALILLAEAESRDAAHHDTASARTPGSPITTDSPAAKPTASCTTPKTSPGSPRSAKECSTAAFQCPNPSQSPAS